jgi:hypothetical protein
MLVVTVSWLWPPISTQYALLRQDMPRILTQIQADPVTVAGITVDVSGELQKLLSKRGCVFAHARAQTLGWSHRRLFTFVGVRDY